MPGALEEAAEPVARHYRSTDALLGAAGRSGKGWRMRFP